MLWKTELEAVMFSSVSRWVNSNPRWLQREPCFFNNQRNLPRGIPASHRAQAYALQVIDWSSAHDLACHLRSPLLSLSTTWTKQKYLYDGQSAAEHESGGGEVRGSLMRQVAPDSHLLPFISVLSFQIVLKPGDETRVPAAEMEVMLWCLSLLLKYKRGALTINVNKRDRSHGYKACYIILLM